MKKFDRSKLRAAEHLHAWLQERSNRLSPIYLPETSWAGINKLARQIRTAQRHGWHRAAARLTERLTRELRHFCERLVNLSAAMENRHTAAPLPNCFDILLEIEDLEEEFGPVGCDLKHGLLCITTDDIDLEGIGLGPFEIRLSWNQVHAAMVYSVVALEANPASSNSSVTHPHVQDEQLCDGDGREAIQAALEHGRFYDFFLLVSRVLATYCPDSAYALLDSWHGPECTDCGVVTHEDYRSFCGSCDEAVCDDCVSYCEGCCRNVCSGCSSSCDDCEQTHCRSCLRECHSCEADVCKTCVQDGLCRKCHKDQENEDLENESAEAAQEEIAPPQAAAVAV